MCLDLLLVFILFTFVASLLTARMSPINISTSANMCAFHLLWTFEENRRLTCYMLKHTQTKYYVNASIHTLRFQLSLTHKQYLQNSIC